LLRFDNMGGGFSKKKKEKDDAPPALASSAPPQDASKSSLKASASVQEDVLAKERKKIAAIEKKVFMDGHTRVDDDVVDDDVGSNGGYDSDVERVLDSDADALKNQEAPDENRRLSLQARIRADGEQWTELVLPPSDYILPENAAHRPDEGLVLDFVHGYRGFDCGSNLFYSVSDEAVYFAGAVGIVMDTTTRRQRHFVGPGNHLMREIVALTLHPSGSIAATAERAFDPHIFVWDLSTMATIRDLSGAHSGGVSALAFTQDGKRLVSAGMDPSHTVAVWEWKNDKRSDPLCKVDLKTEKIFALGCNPRDDVIVACGVRMIEFLRTGHSRTGQRVLEHLPGVFSSANRATHGLSPTMLCCAFTKTEFSLTSSLRNAVEGLCLTGSDIGNIYLWKREEQMDMIVAAHKGCVYALSTAINAFLSGGKDGKVRLWNNDLEPLRNYDISAAAMADTVVKALDFRLGRALVGTASSEVWCLDQTSGEIAPLAQGHSAGGVYAVASHPTKPLYASVGDDAVLRLWDLGAQRQWKSKPLDAPGRSAAFSPEGKVVAVGHSNGSWSVHRVDDLDEVASARDRKKAVLVVRFSPNGRYLAVGSEDCLVDLYDCASDYDWVGTLQGHSVPVHRVDWSADSRVLQTAGEDQEPMFWDAEAQAQLPGFEATRDVDWETYTSTVGWPAQGFLGTGLLSLAACRSLSGRLVAVGNADGLVRVFRYPCVVDGAEEVRARAAAHA
jgi:WD40 repeat protein